ncbi:MAG: carbohydrate binding domain-containing protein, partial [Candidatus Omnitrophota bacterium]|nr:carbohydrate binding domain-containing protein [Candidatus Omnitrophota bacterium]
FLCFSLAAVLLLSSAPDSPAANILTNSGFDEGDFPPAGWSDWSGSGSGEPADGVAGFPAPQEMAYSGDKCIGKIFYGAGDRWGGFSQTVDVIPGNSFEASGWVMNKQNDVPLRNGAKVYIEVKFLGQGEKELKVAKSNSITQPTKWTKLSVRGLVPSGAKKAVFSIVLTGTKKSTGKILFDEASLNIGQ